MKKRIIWLVLSCLMGAALVLSSCAPAVVEEEEEVAPPVEEEEEVAAVVKGPEMVLDSLGRLVEKPQYGGTLVFSWPWAIDGWDPCVAGGHNIINMLDADTLLKFDWSRGPTGSGENSWRDYTFPDPEHLVGGLAESWELKDDTTLIYHIRPGMHWPDEPPANGREFTAADVVFSHYREWHCPKSYEYSAHPYDDLFVSMEATDKYTVVYKLKPGRSGEVFEEASIFTPIYGRDTIEKDGNWSNVTTRVGMGPFMVDDYVPMSSVDLSRNPNYYRHDSLHPDNQLPYVDKLKMLIIPDPATRLTALRTGKIDQMGGITVGTLGWEDADLLKASNPELKYVAYASGTGFTLNYRVDKPELPIYSKRVRQALNMAIDQKVIGDSIYAGNYDLLCWPVANYGRYSEIYIPKEELPEPIKRQFEYHPEEAKKILAEEGYPDGFLMEVLVESVPEQIDLLTIVKRQWAKIGVELTINPQTYAVYNSRAVKKSYPESMANYKSGSQPYNMFYVYAENVANYSQVDDERLNSVRVQLKELFWDQDKAAELYKPLVPYILEQAYCLQLPAPQNFVFWQPWLKGYNGELETYRAREGAWYPYVWIDQELKAEMK